MKLRIKSMLAEGRFAEAIAILPSEIPATEEFSLLAAALYFHENNYNKVVEILDRDFPITENKRARSLFMLAESKYHLNDFSGAETVFAKIPVESHHHDQALYRLGELLKMEGKKDEALKLYKELAETGKNELWIKMAKKELELSDVL